MAPDTIALLAVCGVAFVTIVSMATITWRDARATARRIELIRRQSAPRGEGSDDVLRDSRGYFVVIREGYRARVGDCRDCKYLRGHVNWWCKNKEAIKKHRTRIPGRSNCTFWQEAKRVR